MAEETISIKVIAETGTGQKNFDQLAASISKSTEQTEKSDKATARLGSTIGAADKAIKARNAALKAQNKVQDEWIRILADTEKKEQAAAAAAEKLAAREAAAAASAERLAEKQHILSIRSAILAERYDNMEDKVDGLRLKHEFMRTSVGKAVDAFERMSAALGILGVTAAIGAVVSVTEKAIDRNIQYERVSRKLSFSISDAQAAAKGMVSTEQLLIAAEAELAKGTELTASKLAELTLKQNGLSRSTDERLQGWARMEAAWDDGLDTLADYTFHVVDAAAAGIKEAAVIKQVTETREIYNEALGDTIRLQDQARENVNKFISQGEKEPFLNAANDSLAQYAPDAAGSYNPQLPPDYAWNEDNPYAQTKRGGGRAREMRLPKTPDVDALFSKQRAANDKLIQEIERTQAQTLALQEAGAQARYEARLREMEQLEQAGMSPEILVQRELDARLRLLNESQAIEDQRYSREEDMLQRRLALVGLEEKRRQATHEKKIKLIAIEQEKARRAAENERAIMQASLGAAAASTGAISQLAATFAKSEQGKTKALAIGAGVEAAIGVALETANAAAAYASLNIPQGVAHTAAAATFVAAGIVAAANGGSFSGGGAQRSNQGDMFGGGRSSNTGQRGPVGTMPTSYDRERAGATTPNGGSRSGGNTTVFGPGSITVLGAIDEESAAKIFRGIEEAKASGRIAA